MDPNPGPVLRRRQAGTRLRQLREAAGKSLSDAAAYLECSAAKVSRIETGRLPARVPDVRNMLDLYNVGEPHRTEVLDLVRESREKGWWQDYPDILTDGYDTYIGLESSAAQIWDHQSYLIHGLLQTREYAYAVVAPRMDFSDESADRIVEVRMRRQTILQRPQPPDLHLVLDESALHRALALGPTVGHQQLEHLARVARRPNITLQVLSYVAGIGASSGIPYAIFGFPDQADPKVVAVESLSSTAFESRIDAVAHYTLAFDGLRSAALDPEASIAFITALTGQRR
jgi:transcriptional regulator with XRE-family HTH domain